MSKEILSRVEDLVLIGPSQTKDSYIFAVPFKGNIARDYFNETPPHLESQVRAFQQYWKFNTDTKEINGSNTFLALRLDKALRQEELWIPGVLEVRSLDKEGKLTNGVYRDFGIAVYSNDSPNENIASSLVAQAEKQKLKLPLIVPFRSLDYKTDKKSDYGVNLFFTDDQKSIISGKEAVAILDKFNYKGNSGVRGLYLYRDLGLDSRFGNLAYSIYLGRVDWVCGEATRAELEDAHKNLIERKYDQQIRDLETNKNKEIESFRKKL